MNNRKDIDSNFLGAKYIATHCLRKAKGRFDEEIKYTDAIIKGIEYYILTNELPPIVIDQVPSPVLSFVKNEVIEILNEAQLNTPLPGIRHSHSTIPKPRHWTDAEDKRLFAGVLLYGVGNFEQVSEFLGAGRSRAQCMQRWVRTLDPTISHDKWTEEEDQLLFSLVNDKKNVSWTNIAHALKNRTDVQCRYHYGQLLKKERKQGKIISEIFPQRLESLSSSDSIFDKVELDYFSEKWVTSFLSHFT